MYALVGHLGVSNGVPGTILPPTGESVCISPKEGAEYEWQAYKSQSMPRSKLIFPKGIEKLDQPKLHHIELYHTLGVHFDRVVPQNLLLSVVQQEPQHNTFDTPHALSCAKGGFPSQ